MWERVHQPILRERIGPEATSEHDFEAIVDMLDEGVIVIAADGHLKYINPAGLRMCGLRSERAAAAFLMQAPTSPCYYADGSRVPVELHPAAVAFRAGVS